MLRVKDRSKNLLPIQRHLQQRGTVTQMLNTGTRPEASARPATRFHINVRFINKCAGYSLKSVPCEKQPGLL